MCSSCSSYTGPVLRPFNNGLTSRRQYSNITNEEATQACLAEMDEHPTLYGGDLSKCIAAKKTAPLATATAYVQQGGNFLNNLGQILGIFSNPGAFNQQTPPVAYNPPAAESKGLSLGAWLAIIGGIVTTVVVVVIVSKQGKDSSTKK